MKRGIGECGYCNVDHKYVYEERLLFKHAEKLALEGGYKPYKRLDEKIQDSLKCV